MRFPVSRLQSHPVHCQDNGKAKKQAASLKVPIVMTERQRKGSFVSVYQPEEVTHCGIQSCGGQLTNLMSRRESKRIIRPDVDVTFVALGYQGNVTAMQSLFLFRYVYRDVLVIQRVSARNMQSGFNFLPRLSCFLQNLKS